MGILSFFKKKHKKNMKNLGSWQFKISGKKTLPHQLKRFYHYLKTEFIRLIRLRANIKQIAYGFAIGVFIGIFPTFGVGFIPILILSFFFKFNIPAAIIGSFAGNPIFAPIWIPLSYKLGQFIISLGLKPESVSFLNSSTINKIFHVGINYFLGNIIISAIMAVISYFFIKYLIISYRKQRDRRQNRKKSKTGKFRK